MKNPIYCGDALIELLNDIYRAVYDIDFITANPRSEYVGIRVM